MSLHLRTRVHLHHPAYKTVGNLCFECATSLLSTVTRSQQWKLRVLLDELCVTIANKPSGVKKLIIEEPRTWTADFTHQLLEVGLSSSHNLLEETLKVVAALVQIDCDNELWIRKTITSWTMVNSKRIKHSAVLSLLTLLMKGKDMQSFFADYEEYVLSSIMKGFYHEEAIEQTLECLAAIKDVSNSLSRCHGPQLLSQLLAVAEKGPKCQQIAAELLQQFTTQSYPTSIDWLADNPELVPVMKRIIAKSGSEASFQICQVMLEIFRCSDATGLHALLVGSDMFDVLCNSISTQDHSYIAAAMENIYHLCNLTLGCKGTIATDYYIDRLLRTCLHLVKLSNQEALSKALQSAILLLTNMGECRVGNISKNTQSLALSLVDSILTDDFKLLDTTTLHTIVILNMFLESKLFNTGCVTSLLKLLSQVTLRISVLSAYQTESTEVQELFVTYIRLLNNSLWCATQTDSGSAATGTPEEKGNLCMLVFEALETAVLRIYEHLLVNENRRNLPAISHQVFTLFNAVSHVPGPQASKFTQNFMDAGGLFICLQLKQWDKGEDRSPIATFLAFLVTQFYQQFSRGIGVNISIESVQEIPADINALFAEIFSCKDDRILSMLIDIACAVSLSDKSGNRKLAWLIMESASKGYDIIKFQRLSIQHQIRLSALLANSWSVCCANATDDETTLFTSQMKQGLPLFILENIERAIDSSAHAIPVPADLRLLVWLSKISNTPSTFADLVLIRCSQHHATGAQPFTQCLIEHPPILDNFMVMLLHNRLGEKIVASNIIDDVQEQCKSCPCAVKLAAVCKILEIRLSELLLDYLDRAPGGEELRELWPLRSLVSISQIGYKAHVEGVMTRLLEKVLANLLNYVQSVQDGVLYVNYIITMLYHSITVEDPSIAYVVLNSMQIHKYLNINITAAEESVRLSTTNLLSTMFACIVKFELPVNHSYELPASSLAETFDSTKAVLKAAHLQLWYTYLKWSLRPERKQFITWTCVPGEGHTQGFMEIDFRTMYMYLQQDLLSQVPIIRNAAVKVLDALQLYAAKHLPNLCEGFIEPVWKGIISLHTAAKKEPKEAGHLSMTEGHNSPFINLMGTTFLLVTETDILC